MVDDNYKDHNFVYYHNLNKELGICKAEIMDLEWFNLYRYYISNEEN